MDRLQEHFRKNTPNGKIKWDVNKFRLRTSGRRVFRRCLRKWGFQSSMRLNLERKGAESNIHFWFGSAIHFCMEDYFGYNKFGDPRLVFDAYFDSFKADELPDGAEEHYPLAMGMLDYFVQWYPKYNADMQFRTLWLDTENKEVSPGTEGARPAIEEEFTLDLGIEVVVDAENGDLVGELTDEIREYLTEVQMFGDSEEVDKLYTYSPPDPNNPGMFLYQQQVKIFPIHYHGTLDRLVVDRFGRWWIMDYKTAKGADTNKLDTDDQISAYMWAAEQWFQHRIHGFIYLQLTKDIPKPPKRLKNGALSTDKKQKTTHQLYKAEILKDFGSVQKAPNKMIETLNSLAEQETPEGDRFIRWDLVTRTNAQKVSTYHHILAEAREMVNPDKYLYPNPTRDCIWDCPFREACIAMDDERIDDAIASIEANFEPRDDSNESNRDNWRERIKWPESPAELSVENIKVRKENLFNLVLPDEYYGDYEGD